MSDLRSRANGQGPRMSASIRKTLDIAMGQSGHSLRERLIVCCRMPKRDVEGFVEAASDLYWLAINRAQDTMSRDEDEDVQRFITAINEASEEFRVQLARFLDTAGGAAFLEGWVAGVIYSSEKEQALVNASRRRPGR